MKSALLRRAAAAPSSSAEAAVEPATSSPSLRHIGEIDGLRAIAVLAVLFYHCEFKWMRGGFIGVDVFFVISGYLITKILLSDMTHGKIRIARFYKRRILRIAPALFTSVACTGVIFLVILPPAISGNLIGSFAAALLSYSNFFFYSTIDYFAEAQSNPLLHTWSLAVEEQFYLAFPLLLLTTQPLLANSGRFRMFLVLGATSLIMAGAIAPISQAQAFYFPWLRAWELLTGSVLSAISLSKISSSAKVVLSNGGLVLIIACALNYDNRMVFPGYSAALPVIGAGAVIAGTGAKSLSTILLGHRSMQYIGRISYSLYLVHWPLVCLASVLLSIYPTAVKVATVIASLVLGAVSWRWVEQPFRALAPRTSAKAITVAFGIGILAVLTLLCGSRFASVELWKMFPEAAHYAEARNVDKSFFSTGHCFLNPNHRALSRDCLTLQNGKANVLVMGDSHAANLVQGLVKQHPSVNFLQATSPGCKPLLVAHGPKYCVDLARYMYKDWLPQHVGEVDKVVLGGRWDQADAAHIDETVAYLKQMGIKVVLVGPSPEYFITVPIMLAYRELLSIDWEHWFLKKDRIALDKEFSNRWSKQIEYFSLVNTLCAAPNRCRSHEGRESNFFDRDHLTPSGVREAIRGFPLP